MSKTILILITFFLVSSLRAADLKISGNERTRNEYLENLMAECIDKHSDKENDDVFHEALSQCVINSGLFNKVEVKSDTAGNLTVNVEERWTLLILPQVISEAGGTRYGLFVLERNIFGLGHLLAAGVSFGSGGTSFFGFYSNPSINFSDWGYKVSAVNSSSDVYMNFKEIEDVDVFHENKVGGGVALSYKFNDQEISAGLNYFDFEYEELMDLENSFLVPKNRVETTGSLNYRINLTDYKFFYSEGFRFRADSTQYISGNGEQGYSNYVFSAGLGLGLSESFALSGSLESGVMSDATRESSFRLGRKKGFRGIPSGRVWADEYTVGSVNLDYLLKGYGYGFWTAGPFVDVGKLAYIDSVMVESENRVVEFGAYGVGVYLYLRKVVFPGVGIEYGVNPEFGGSFYSFALGFDF